MLKLAGCVTLLFLGIVSGQRCIYEFYNSLDACDAMWGYDSSASLDFNVGGLLNITKLIQYCRNPNRPNLSTCINGAYDVCTPAWPAEELSLIRKQTHFQSQAVDYLCFENADIETNKECLERVGGEITACARNAVFGYDSDIRRVFSETSQSITWETKKTLMERKGRNKEVCVVELMKTQCNVRIANILGNFFYASSVYVFDESN